MQVRYSASETPTVIDDLVGGVVVHAVQASRGCSAMRLAQFQFARVGGVVRLARLAASGCRPRRIGLGVVKSGSPMPSEMTSFIVAAMSKNLRMPEGFSPATRLERYFVLPISCISPPELV